MDSLSRVLKDLAESLNSAVEAVMKDAGFVEGDGHAWELHEMPDDLRAPEFLQWVTVLRDDEPVGAVVMCWQGDEIQVRSFSNGESVIK